MLTTSSTAATTKPEVVWYLTQTKTRGTESATVDTSKTVILSSDRSISDLKISDKVRSAIAGSFLQSLLWLNTQEELKALS
jgi:hypothetical protein